MVKINRGDVWSAALDPTVGGEIQETRPCLVISPPEIHDWLRTVMVAPMTTVCQPAPFRIPIIFKRKSGVILLDQIQVLDKGRLVKRLRAADQATLKATLDTLQELFAR
jgi:mRNA interferase MazF